MYFDALLSPHSPCIPHLVFEGVVPRIDFPSAMGSALREEIRLRRRRTVDPTYSWWSSYRAGEVCPAHIFRFLTLRGLLLSMGARAFQNSSGVASYSTVCRSPFFEITVVQLGGLPSRSDLLTTSRVFSAVEEHLASSWWFFFLTGLPLAALPSFAGVSSTGFIAFSHDYPIGFVPGYRRTGIKDDTLLYDALT